MNEMLLQWVGAFGKRIHERLGEHLDGYMAKLDGALIASGDPAEVHAPELLGIQVVSAVAFPVIWGYILAYIPLFDFLFNGPHQVFVIMLLILFGFMFPYLNVRDRIGKRQQEIGLQLPDVIDLLTVCVEAGLDFVGALRVVVDRQQDGALKDELVRFLRQLELGKTRSEGLRELSKRVKMSDISTVAAALIQADRLGAPIGQTLRVQSDLLRTRRGQRAEKAAMQATVKMLAPLMICIMPAVFIMILAPVFIQMGGNLR